MIAQDATEKMSRTSSTSFAGTEAFRINWYRLDSSILFCKKISLAIMSEFYIVSSPERTVKPAHVSAQL
jgi:hypothetical protein